jgi:hypothetical protein
VLKTPFTPEGCSSTLHSSDEAQRVLRGVSLLAGVARTYRFGDRWGAGRVVLRKNSIHVFKTSQLRQLPPTFNL